MKTLSELVSSLELAKTHLRSGLARSLLDAAIGLLISAYAAENELKG